LSGETAASSKSASLQMMNPFLTLLIDPFIATRGGSAGNFGAAMGFAPERRLTPEVAAAYAALTPEQAKKKSEGERRWSVWGSAYGGHNLTNGAAADGSHSTAVRAAGAAVGMDYKVDPDSIVGFALAAGSTNWSVSDGLGGGSSDVF